MATKTSNLVTHTIPNLVAGVSQQFTEARFETQVEEMENCVPSIARGVIRRNPVNTVKASYTTIPDTSFVYSYDRGTGIEQYSIEVDGSGNWYVHNINTGTLISSGYKEYFTLPAGSIARDSFEAVTIGDYTFIINKTKTVEMHNISTTQSITNYNLYQNNLIYWIKKTTAVQTDTSSDTSNTVNGDNVVTASETTTGTRLEGYTYTLIRDTSTYSVTGEKDTREGYSVDLLSSDDIAASMASKFFYMVSTKSFVYTNPGYTLSNWSYEDTFGNEASLLIHKVVDNASKLPSVMPISYDKIVKISGAFSSEYDDYYMRYDASEQVWNETVAPNIKTELNENTMPHVLVRKSDGSFVCSPYKESNLTALGLDAADIGWKERTAGDEVTIETPSFVGQKLVNIFFHKNRLGVITKESIVLSETANYGNFFGTTVQSLPDDDPIDLMVATTDVTVLRDAVSTAGVLILFSDDSQFTLTSNGVLTPSSATINTASNYTYTSNAKAVANKVYFISQSGGYSQLFAYRLTEGLQSTEAEQLTAHMPSYLPNNITKVVGHSTLGYVFMLSFSTPNIIYVLNTTAKQGQDVQNAFHKWVFDFDIINIEIINNKLILLGKTDTDTILYDMSLEIPGDISSTSYLDNGTDSYTSRVTMSKFHVKDGNGIGTNRGRTQIRTALFSTKENSKYMVTIYNSKYSTNPDTTEWLLKSGFWDDNGEWLDTSVWKDAYPLYVRNYFNDKKISVLSNSEDVRIEFKNNSNDASAGFELSTVDIEALFFQRASRM